MPARCAARARPIAALRPAPTTGAATPSFFHCGDNAYFEGFGEIGRRHEIDIALMPIGAYGPERYFADVHINPEDALLAASVLGARIAIGHHWGTFNLGAESPAEARSRFLAARAKGVKPMVLDVGQAVAVK